MLSWRRSAWLRPSALPGLRCAIKKDSPFYQLSRPLKTGGRAEKCAVVRGRGMQKANQTFVCGPVRLRTSAAQPRRQRDRGVRFAVYAIPALEFST